MTTKKLKSAAPAPNPVMALALPPEASLPAAIRAVFDKCVEKLGFVPNVLRAYTLRPKKFEPFRVYNNELMLGESGLSKLEREMIAVVVSCANHCHYCLIAHGAAVRVMAGDATLGDQLVTNYRTATLDARTRAMLDFAWALTVSPATIGDEDRAGLRRAGFADEDIFDIAEVAGFYNMTNRLAAAVEMRPNGEYFSAGR
ncbi:MAG: alkylhydroperoxidase [Alphaproteobacteria bacterium]|nr:alkylhydroperoxidase [Alphaproteobacteria bacterium]